MRIYKKTFTGCYKMNLVLPIIFLCSCLVSAGCVYIPTDYHAGTSRREIGDKDTSKIIPGESTKEDVLLLLGEPDRTSPGGKTLLYTWSKVKYLVYIHPFPLLDEVVEDTTLVIIFNEKGFVENAEYQKSLMGQPIVRIPITLWLVKNSHVPFERLLAKAQCGIVEAQELVAVSYHHGAGVGKDLIKAATWYKIAADHASKYAASELLQLKKDLTLNEYLKAEMAARTWQPDSAGCQASGYEDEKNNH